MNKLKNNVLIILVLFTLFIGRNVFAKSIDANIIKDNINSKDSTLTAIVDKENKKISVLKDSANLFELNYTDNTISYTSNVTTIDENNYLEIEDISKAIYNIVNIMLNESGFEDLSYLDFIQFNTMNTLNNSYDSNTLKLLFNKVTVSGTNPNIGDWSRIVFQVKNFSMILDTDKISSLAKAYDWNLSIKTIFNKLNKNIENVWKKQVGDVCEITLKDDMILFYSNSSLISKLSYTNGILTEENSISENEDIATRYLYYNVLLETIGELNGYTERDYRLFFKINDEATLTNDGYVIDYNVQASSLNFQVDVNAFGFETNYLDLEAPTIKVVDKTSNSVSIIAYSSISDKLIEMYISEDGINYEYLNINIGGSTSDNEAKFTFDDLKPGKTYYIKGVVEKSKNFSEPVSFTTLTTAQGNNTSESTITKNEDETIANPKTGLGISVVTCSSLIIGFICLSNYLKNKNKINNI